MGEKKRLSINLSFLTFTDSTKQISSHKSPKSFEEPNGVVGLGILAALNDDDNYHQDPIFNNGGRAAVLAISPRFSSNSNPIPIIVTQKSFSKNNTKKKLSVEEMELCEEYTCVTSHVGDNLIEKREFFDADFLGKNNGFEMVSAFDSSLSCGGENATFEIADFLSSCFLCKKMLHGLDIFMYRGEKAFCSTECRYRQISIDDKKEKRRNGLRKTTEYSGSPCSSTLQFFAGVAAA
ncbi:hypothetical protein ACJIZ3_018909 [Penstemon smallii]|uniref:FLZ-type domain-containing protein n=1 Tax=Penstemon smallii TaxID=265156 RepID=A0ABD3T157_9LAMI